MESGCWQWTGPLSKQGYGHFSKIESGKGFGRGTAAHRFSYELFKGPILPGLFVLHSCDNPACVNPAHLDVGTQKTNMRDCVSRGRFRGFWKAKRGSANQLAKLTEADVIDIRSSSLSIKALAEKYGVDRTNVHQILTGKTWAHVPMPAVRVAKADGRAKLNRAQVEQIKNASAKISHRELSLQYGVGVPTISMIRNGRIWKSVVASENVNGN